ncbi:MAG: TIGR02444 family protein, partial [Acidobacteriota bacterium]
MTETRADSFWSFTLAFYGRTGVSGALIALQDRFSHDVNVLLYACWLGLHEGVPLTEAERAAAAARVEPWRKTVLLPLRAARRAIKAAAIAE